jgi:hypothetical protein
MRLVGVEMSEALLAELAELAATYFHRCDAYDQAACTGRYKGESIPATSEERQLIERHAQHVIVELMERSRIPRRELFQAIRMYARYQRK